MLHERSGLDQLSYVHHTLPPIGKRAHILFMWGINKIRNSNIRNSGNEVIGSATATLMT